MFGFKTVREQLMEERRKNASLQAELAKANADIEYISMMIDVEMEEQEAQEDGEV